jgi:outer membrane protein assembly factor BamB
MKQYLLLFVLTGILIVGSGCINSGISKTNTSITPVVSYSMSGSDSSQYGIHDNKNLVPNLSRKWSYPTGIIETPPVVANGVVYVGSLNGKVFALDEATGTKIWDYNTGKIQSDSVTLAVVNNVVYAGNNNGTVYAFNATTGSKLWNTTVGGPIWWSTPTVANGIVYVGSEDFKLNALDAATGTKLWEYKTGGQVESSPTVVNGIVYIGSDDKKIYALNASTGVKQWDYIVTRYTGGVGGVPYWWQRPVVENGVVYAVSWIDGTVYAFDAITGTKIWEYSAMGDYGSTPTAQSSGNMPGFLSSPAVAKGIVYVGSYNDKVYALDASNGRKLWEYTTGGYTSTPAIADGFAYVWSQDGKIYVLNATTGAKLGEYSYAGGPGERLASYPVVNKGVAFLGVESFENRVNPEDVYNGRLEAIDTNIATPDPVQSSFGFTAKKTIFPTITVPNLKSPYITINDVGTHYAGDSFYINGFSDLPNGSRLHVDIKQQLGRHPQHGDEIMGFDGDAYLNASENHRKSWELLVETSGFVPAMYDVTITSVDYTNVTERVFFNITARPVT